MIDKGKQYRTRGGHEVRIYATDGETAYPIHGAIKDNGEWESTTWTADGLIYENKPDNDLDLVEVKPRIKHTLWLNIYPDNAGSYLYNTRVEANNAACKDRVACVQIDIDVEEGEGLDGD